MKPWGKDRDGALSSERYRTLSVIFPLIIERLFYIKALKGKGMGMHGDAFFTSCEEAIHPELRGKPVITGGERGIVACASYPAKKRRPASPWTCRGTSAAPSRGCSGRGRSTGPRESSFWTWSRTGNLRPIRRFTAARLPRALRTAAGLLQRKSAVIYSAFPIPSDNGSRN